MHNTNIVIFAMASTLVICTLNGAINILNIFQGSCLQYPMGGCRIFIDLDVDIIYKNLSEVYVQQQKGVQLHILWKQNPRQMD